MNEQEQAMARPETGIAEAGGAKELEAIATEVNAIKKTTMDTINQIAGKAAIEIGRRLFRAKQLVGHGNWGAWLEENVSYSQRTASDLIAIFERFDKGQQLLFGQTLPDELLESIGPTKLKLLMSIKDDEKLAEFAQEHDVEGMSTRELKRALDEAEGKPQAQEDTESVPGQTSDAGEELAKAREEAEALQRQLEDMASQLADAKAKTEEANERAEANEKRAGEYWQKQNDTYRKQLRAEQELKSMEGRLKDMTERAESAERSREESEQEANEQIRSLSEEAEELKRKLKDAEEAANVPPPAPPEAPPAGSGENQEERRIGVFRANFEVFRQSFGTMLKTLKDMNGENREKFRAGLKTLAQEICSVVEETD